MARGKDLAGLAALGALGMMLSKGKKGSDTSGMDTEGFEGIKDLPRRDTGMSEKEPDENYRNSGPRTSPTASRARATTPTPTPSSRSTISADDEAGMSRGTRPRDPRNAEAGMSRGTRTTSMAGAGRGVTMPTQPQADSTTAEGMRNYVPRRTPQANSTTEEGMRNYVSRAPTGMERDTSEVDRVRNLAGAFNVPIRPRGSEDGFKKGGAVKKMASGGMASSASKRADGIAQKGKTKGRMC
jgi:hypothetical protein